MKRRKHRTTLFRQILNVFTFKREISLLKGLARYKRSHLVTPNIIETDGKQYMIQEKLEGNYLKCNYNICNICEISAGIRELHEFRGENHVGRFWRLFQKHIMSLGVSIHRGVIKLAIMDGRPAKAFTALRIFYLSLFRCRSQACYFFHHRDLINHDNSFTLKDGRLGLIDFGNGRAERRWVLMDIIDISIDYDLNVHRKLIHTCIERVSPLCDKPLILRDQVRISLMRRLMHPARLYGPRCQDFFLNVLLDDVKYDEWYRQNVSCD